MDATVNYDKPLTAERLMAWLAALFPAGYSGLRKIRVVRWRGLEAMQVVSGPVGREKVHFEAPPAERVEKEIGDFLRWWEKGSKNIEGLLRAAIAHFRFVTIHPFEDGNGRKRNKPLSNIENRKTVIRRADNFNRPNTICRFVPILRQGLSRYFHGNP
jgi:Fic family protein